MLRKFSLERPIAFLCDGTFGPLIAAPNQLRPSIMLIKVAIMIGIEGEKIE